MKKKSLAFICGLACIGGALCLIQNQERSNQTQVPAAKLTFDEMVEQIAKENCLYQGEVITQLVSQKKENLQDQNPDLQVDEGKVASQLRAATYQNSTIAIPSVSSYQPEGIRFYYTIDEREESPNRIGEICWTSLDYVDLKTGIAKKFAGSVYVHRVDFQTIDWMVNGDFFDHAITKGDPNEIGQSAYTTIETPLLADHFAYYNQSGRYFIE